MTGTIPAAGRTLDALYRWFQTELDRPMPGFMAPPGHAAVESLITPSHSLPPEERLGVYQFAVRARLIDVLGSDFPAMRHVLGGDAFIDLAEAYLNAYPSRSFTLNDLCDKLPRFLRTHTKIPHHRVVLDLARLERVMTKLVDSPTSEVLTPEQIATVPSDQWADARLEPIPALRVLAFNSRANAIVTAVRQETELPPLDDVETWTAVYRKPDFVIWRMNLPRPMYVLLDSLAGGHRIGDAVERASREWSGELEDLEQGIFRWFGELVGEGLFRRVILP